MLIKIQVNHFIFSYVNRIGLHAVVLFSSVYGPVQWQCFFFKWFYDVQGPLSKKGLQKK